MNNNSQSSTGNNKGFSIIEIVIFIVVFSLGVVGIMTLFSNVLSKSSDPTIRLRAVQAAQATMDEIIARKFDENTPNGGGNILAANMTAVGNFGLTEGSEDFLTIDDVDDYDGVNCATAPNSTTCFDVSQGFTVAVTVTYGALDGADNTVKAAAGTDNYKIIQVDVTSTVSTETIRLVAVKGNF